MSFDYRLKSLGRLIASGPLSGIVLLGIPPQSENLLLTELLLSDTQLGDLIAREYLQILIHIFGLYALGIGRDLGVSLDQRGQLLLAPACLHSLVKLVKGLEYSLLSLETLFVGFIVHGPELLRF